MDEEPVMARRRRKTHHALTPTQLYLLKVFENDDSEETAQAIQSMVFQYYQKKLDEETDRLWDEGILDQKKLDEIRHTDLHAK
jgi:hypothetical protein